MSNVMTEFDAARQVLADILRTHETAQQVRSRFAADHEAALEQAEASRQQAQEQSQVARDEEQEQAVILLAEVEALSQKADDLLGKAGLASHIQVSSTVQPRDDRRIPPAEALRACYAEAKAAHADLRNALALLAEERSKKEEEEKLARELAEARQRRIRQWTLVLLFFVGPLVCIFLFWVYNQAQQAASPTPVPPEVKLEQWQRWINETFEVFDITPVEIRDWPEACPECRSVSFQAKIRNNDTQPHTLKVWMHVLFMWADGEVYSIPEGLFAIWAADYAEKEFDIAPGAVYPLSFRSSLGKSESAP